MLHSLCGERKCCQKSSENLAEACSSSRVLVNISKNKQPGRGDPKQSKSYQVLLKNINNPLVPLQLRFFEETAAKLESFVLRFQTDNPMVLFLVSHLEAIIRELCSKVILDDAREDAQSTRSLMKLDVTDKSIQKVTPNLGFGLKSDIKNLKAVKKVRDSHAHIFLLEVKKFLSSLCNHLLTKPPIQSQFACCCRSINPIFMDKYPDSCRKLLDQILEKLVSSKHFTEVNADAAKNEYANFLQTVATKNRSSFQDFRVDEVGLNEFFMGYFNPLNASVALI